MSAIEFSAVARPSARQNKMAALEKKMLQIAFLVALWYAWVDWKYVRDGGKKTTRRELMAWLIAGGAIFAVACAVMYFIIGIEDFNEFSTAAFNALLAIIVLAFILYEARRWTIRRENPITSNR